MLDELDVLRGDGDLRWLLEHYAQGGAADRLVWQDRVMVRPGLSQRELSRLHGLLIAFSWVEQNTGAIGPCYRITAAGLRVVKPLAAAA